MTLALIITGLWAAVALVGYAGYVSGFTAGYSRAWQDVAEAHREAERENHQWNR